MDYSVTVDMAKAFEYLPEQFPAVIDITSQPLPEEISQSLRSVSGLKVT